MRTMQNLWTGYDDHDQAIPPESVGRAEKQSVSRRQPTEQAILSSLREWLLQDYAAAYCRSLAATRIFRRCYWIDGLGGGLRTTQAPAKDISKAKGGTSPAPTAGERRPGELGLYTLDDFSIAGQDAAGERDQSRPYKSGRRKHDSVQELPPALQPVVALSQALAQESRPITLQGLVLDGGKGRRKDGKSAKEGNTDNGFTLPRESNIVHAAWPEIALALLAAIDQSAAIFLLNPLAGSAPPAARKREIPFFMYEDLAPLYQRTTPTELCLLISHKQVATTLLPSLRTPGGASAFTALLRSDRWKALLANGGEMARTISGLIDAFVASMRQQFLSVQRIALAMQVGPAVGEEVPYTLIFATRRQDSLGCMNDAVCRYHRRLDEQSHRGMLTEDWFAAQQRERFTSL